MRRVERDLPILALRHKARGVDSSIRLRGGLAVGYGWCRWCSRDNGSNAGEDHGGPHADGGARSVSADRLCWMVVERV